MLRMLFQVFTSRDFATRVYTCFDFQQFEVLLKQFSFIRISHYSNYFTKVFMLRAFARIRGRVTVQDWEQVRP
jgi:hypothetical protein